MNGSLTFWRRIAAATAVSTVLVAAAAGGGAAGIATTTIPPTDVLLAFDTTGSMAPSIAASKAAAENIVSSITAIAPGAHFAVASFRDRYYPGGEYTLEQPMTASPNAVVAAIGRLHAVKTLDTTKDTDAEAYNLLFHETYTDGHIGWGPAARKIVIVIGDAEPHGAGADGLSGCSDTTHDWDGLDSAHELAAMQRAKITLVMMRQASTATTRLACYSSLADRAYAGGAAVDTGTSGVAATVVSLVKGAYAPFAVTPQLTSGVAGKTDGIVVRLANPNSYPLTISDFTVTLPPNVSYQPGSSKGSLGEPVADGTLLTWQLTQPLAPYSATLAHIVVRAAKAGAGSIAANATATAPDGTTTPLHATAALKFVAHPRLIDVSIDGQRGTTSVTARLSAPLGQPRKHAPGSLVVRLAGNRSVTVVPVTAAAPTVGAPTLVKFRGRVLGSTGLRGCKAGTAVSATITDSDVLTAAGINHDALTVGLPQSCGGTHRFGALNGGSLSVTLAFR